MFHHEEEVPSAAASGAHAHHHHHPPPIVTHYSTDSIVYKVIKKFNQRAEFGLKKYGTNLDREDLFPHDWIQHAQEELMDGILYLEKLKSVIPPPVVEDFAPTPTTEPITSIEKLCCINSSVIGAAVEEDKKEEIDFREPSEI